MKAAVIDGYGGNEVVEVREIPAPAPGEKELLVRVRAASVNPVDWKIRSGKARLLTGHRFPKILGLECAGEIVETGPGVERFSRGESVVVYTGIRRLGAFAEHVCAPEPGVFPKPQNLTFEESSTLPIAALTSLQSLRDLGLHCQSRPQSPRRVLRLLPGASLLYFGQFSELVFQPEVEESSANIVSDKVATQFGKEGELLVKVVGTAGKNVNPEFELFIVADRRVDHGIVQADSAAGIELEGGALDGVVVDDRGCEGDDGQIDVAGEADVALGVVDPEAELGGDFGEDGVCFNVLRQNIPEAEAVGDT
jgi:hypothetical protein